MNITILTLFPNMFEGFKNESIIKRAMDRGICTINVIDIREYSLDKHHHVDDTPCGGGAGMVLRVDIVHRAILSNSKESSHIILMTPQGHSFKQNDARILAQKEDLVIVCGHYEGFDERIRNYVDEEISIGDYVLTGGELPAMVVSDSVIRLLQDTIKEESHEDDSFSNGLLEYPQYTRPIEYDGNGVPEVLLNGNHKLIQRFRKKESLRRTLYRRPDLLKNYVLSEEEKKLLKEIEEEQQ